VRREDLTDDRLAAILDDLGDDAGWAALEAALNQRTIRVYQLGCQRIRLDATTAISYLDVTADGLVQFGHSKDHRPDLPQIKINVAALDPLGMPVMTEVVAGNRADDPLYLPAIRRVQQSVGRSGLTYIGDGKMGSLETRAAIVASGNAYLCPLGQVQVSLEEMQPWLTSVVQGEQRLIRVERPGRTAPAPSEVIADGFERQVRLTAEVNGQPVTWDERRLVIRSYRAAHAQERALRARVDQALTALLALNQRGRGRKRFTESAALQAVCQQIVTQAGVEGLIDVQVSSATTERPVRRYGQRPARMIGTQALTVQARVNQTAVTERQPYLGWRVYATSHAATELSLEQAVLAYREQFIIEQPFGRLKHTPLSLTPMYLDTESRIVGLVRLLSLGLRVLTLTEGVVRRTLRQQGDTVTGLSAGNPKRGTDRPTTEMLLRAFTDVTLTIIQHEGTTIRHMPPLSATQQQILALIGLSPQIYERLTEHFSNSS
jgi:transposase